MKVNTVIEGDCLDVMSQFPDNCIDTIITDPPYGLEFMGKNWDHGIPGIAYWREALRVAKPGATLLAFGGTRTYHRLACAIEDAGWEIRDCINNLHDGSFQEAAFMASLNDEQLAAYLELHRPNNQMAWVYGQGIGLGHNISKAIDKAKGAEREVVGVGVYANRGRVNGNNQCSVGDSSNSYITAPSTPLAAKFDGWNTRLKPSFEPIILAQKPLDGTYADNAERWDLAGLNIDGGRVIVEEGDKNKRKSTGGYGNNGNGGVTNFQYNHTRDATLTNGRWPANTIHDGSNEVEAEFAKAGVRTSGSKNIQRQAGIWSKEIINLPIHNDNGGDSGSASRFFYTAKASPSERGDYNCHPTVKPLALLKYLARLTRPPDGGIVLDMFAGSGTTALACIAENRDYILIEKEPEYVEIIKRRIAEYTGQEIAPKEIELNEKQIVKQLGLW